MEAEIMNENCETTAKKRRRTVKPETNPGHLTGKMTKSFSSMNAAIASSVYNDLCSSTSSQGIDDGQKPRSHANARERDRTHRSNAGICVSVNSAFTTLRTLIPTEPADRKLSKIETLRLASSYIAHLGTQLLAGPMEQPCLKHNGPVPGYDTSNPRPVCTFCLSSMKKMKNHDGFTYRDSSQMPINGNDASIFFHTQDISTPAASCDPFETNMNLLFY